MLGHPRDSLEVLIYQLVHLVEGGEAKKMSKRRGDVVFVDELVDALVTDPPFVRRPISPANRAPCIARSLTRVPLRVLVASPVEKLSFTSNGCKRLF